MKFKNSHSKISNAATFNSFLPLIEELDWISCCGGCGSVLFPSKLLLIIAIHCRYRDGERHRNFKTLIWWIFWHLNAHIFGWLVSRIPYVVKASFMGFNLWRSRHKKLNSKLKWKRERISDQFWTILFVDDWTLAEAACFSFSFCSFHPFYFQYSFAFSPFYCE